jgi:hypothetical protein
MKLVIHPDAPYFEAWEVIFTSLVGSVVEVLHAPGIDNRTTGLIQGVVESEGNYALRLADLDTEDGADVEALILFPAIETVTYL